jgi:uncharacterized membrane protein
MVDEGFALTVAALVLLSPLAGDQLNVLPAILELADKFTGIDGQVETAAGVTFTEGRGLRVITT